MLDEKVPPHLRRKCRVDIPLDLQDLDACFRDNPYGIMTAQDLTDKTQSPLTRR